MKNLTKTQLVLSVAGLLLLSGQVSAVEPAYHGHYDRTVTVQNTPELQAIHDANLRPITPGHLMGNAAFDGIGSLVKIQNTPELQAIHDSMQRPLHPGHIGANSAFDGKSSWSPPDRDEQVANIKK